VCFFVGDAETVCSKCVHFYLLKQYLRLLLFHFLFLKEFYQNNLQMIDVHNIGEKAVNFIGFFF